MSVEIPPSPDARRRDAVATASVDDGYVAGRIEAWLAAGGDAPDPPEARDEQPRRRDVLNPCATRIGYPEDPDDDLAERLRALHAERRDRLGLDDPDWLADDEEYERLRGEGERSPAGFDRLEATIERELDDGTLDTAVLGHSPYRDPYLPPFEHRSSNGTR